MCFYPKKTMGPQYFLACVDLIVNFSAPQADLRKMSEVRSCPKLLLVTQVLVSGGEDEGVISFSGFLSKLL